MTDRFSRHTHRLGEALKRGEISFAGFGLASFFLGEIDNGRDADSVAYTLAGLKSATGWPQSSDTLSRELHQLLAGGWICFESKPGQRRARPPHDLRTTSAKRGPHLRR